MGWPLTNGSRGSCISRGVSSPWEFFEGLARAASVFARPLKSADPEAGEGWGKLLVPAGNDDWVGEKFGGLEDVSELRD